MKSTVKKLDNPIRLAKVVEGVECANPNCREQIWSRHEHDVRYCHCSQTFVDGGREYFRFGGIGNPKPILIVLVEVDQNDLEASLMQLDAGIQRRFLPDVEEAHRELRKLLRTEGR